MSEIRTNYVKDTTIYIVRGDSMNIPITFRINGKNYVPGDFEKIHSQCKMLGNEEYIVWDKIIDNKDMVLHIYPCDTEDLDPRGKYVYDVQIESDTGEVTTFIPLSPLIIMNDVTSRGCGCKYD